MNAPASGVAASRVHVPGAPPLAENLMPTPKYALSYGAPVPTNTVSVAAVAPNRTAMAPTESESASSPEVKSGELEKSSRGAQVAPLSPENQTPPLAEPAYTREPPGPTALLVNRPLTPGVPGTSPLAITEGPMGVQLTEPSSGTGCTGAGAGGPGGA